MFFLFFREAEVCPAGNVVGPLNLLMARRGLPRERAYYGLLPIPPSKFDQDVTLLAHGAVAPNSGHPDFPISRLARDRRGAGICLSPNEATGSEISKKSGKAR